PLIKESLGGLIIIRSEIVEEDGRDTLRVFEKEIIDQQDWGLPAIRINYIPLQLPGESEV
ncbi:MAG: hypothetical protein ACI9T8_000435, partial [Candidatus Saccharimonadales bacterium]